MGVKIRAGDVVHRVDWLILLDAKCRAEKLISSQLFHNTIVARATFYTHWKSASKAVFQCLIFANRLKELHRPRKFLHPLEIGLCENIFQQSSAITGDRVKNKNQRTSNRTTMAEAKFKNVRTARGRWLKVQKNLPSCRAQIIHSGPRCFTLRLIYLTNKVESGCIPLTWSSGVSTNNLNRTSTSELIKVQNSFLEILIQTFITDKSF